jgi:hypothetical protein
MSQLKCCIQEWATGQHMNVAFTSDLFAADYAGIMETISQVRAHPYHGLSFQEAKRQWACTGVFEILLLHP